ncbi:succinate dehydrogenase, cytochrome b556 subunit [Anaplasma marginale]|uniref:succinate dehydrogenase, cytochrome b556 subunit n=1 Tax=Anaplasma marginale TaxID=770 RepID=UPI001F51BDF5|nr:hypothetical protein [Anaplasma marginale]
MLRSRPLSPHLQVYKLPVAALLSITHRASGLFLFFWIVGAVVAFCPAALCARLYRALLG